METTPQQNRQGRRSNIFSTLAWMVVAFLAGIYVGLHPTLIPIDLNSKEEINPPTSSEPISDQSREVPQTQPATSRPGEGDH